MAAVPMLIVIDIPLVGSNPQTRNGRLAEAQEKNGYQVGSDKSPDTREHEGGRGVRATVAVDVPGTHRPPPPPLSESPDLSHLHQKKSPRTGPSPRGL